MLFQFTSMLLFARRPAGINMVGNPKRQFRLMHRAIRDIKSRTKGRRIGCSRMMKS